MSRKYISQFYDINKNTQAEQVLENMSEIDELKQTDLDLQSNIDDEAQTRNDADAALAEDVNELKERMEALGNVFTLKGSVATIADLPSTGNNIGDVYYVVAENVGYVWIDDNGAERWEQLGLPIDLSQYVTTTEFESELENYQDKLTAGSNITILGNVISAQVPDINRIRVLTGDYIPSLSTIGTPGQLFYTYATKDLYICESLTVNTETGIVQYNWKIVAGAAKQDKLTAGTNITIDANNVISASGGGKQLYEHHIIMQNNTSSTIRYFLRVTIVCDRSTPFDTADLATYLYNKGFTSNIGALQVSGAAFDMRFTDSILIPYGLYASSASSITLNCRKYIHTTDGSTISISQENSTSTIAVSNDEVVTL